ncbi:MAG: LamG-like jellyroll fold domain-containing protein [Saprospiraceae bacterium]
MVKQKNLFRQVNHKQINLQQRLKNSWLLNAKSFNLRKATVIVVFAIFLMVGSTAQAQNALDFNGTDDYVSLPNNFAANFSGGQVTISSWVYLKSYTQWGTIIKNWGPNFGAFHFGFKSTTGQLQIIFTQSSDGVNKEVLSPNIIPLNQWVHVAFVADGSSATLYEDGVSVGSTPYDGTINTIVPYTVIGAKPSHVNTIPPAGVSPGYINGILDDLRVWNTGRTAAEINDYKDCELTGTESGLIAYYNFNQGIAGGTNTGVTTLTDLTGNGNDGTLTNFALTGSTSNWVANVITPTTPSVVIASDDPDNTITLGTSVTFTATPTGGGGTPAYQWKKNSTNVGTDSETYTDAALADGDVITVEMTSSSSCAVSNPATSNGITMTVVSGVLDFDGSDDYVDCGAVGQTTTMMTLEAWVNPDAGYGTFTDGSEPVEIISRWGGGGVGNASYRLGINSSGQVTFQVYNGSGSSTVTSSATIPTAAWTHIVGVRNGNNELLIYINGALDGTTTGATVAQVSNYNVYLGKPIAGNNRYRGQLDEVRIWNIALDAADITAHYNKTFSNPTVPASCLLAYYTFEEGTGTTTADVTGNGHTGTLTNMANDDWVTISSNTSSGTAPDCPTNFSLVFNGINYVECGSSIPQLGAAFTIEAWVKPNVGYGSFSSTSDALTIAGQWGNVGANNAAYRLGLTNTGNVQLAIHNGSANSVVTSTTIVATEVWTHIIGVRDANNDMHIYINGVLDATINNAGLPQASTYPLTLAKPHVGFDNRYSGELDEVRIWNEAFTASNVTAYYNKTFSNPVDIASCLLAYYKFDDAAGTSLTDETGNGNTGTLFNSPTWNVSGITVTTSTAPACAVLPVELTTFNVRQVEQEVLLTWQTASEENNRGFEVERSIDGINFEKIGFIAGNGTTVEVSNYNFFDENPINGINYYRLKQLDFDEQFEYSEIRSVSIGIGNDKMVQIYPNPVQNELTIQDGIGNITIFNALGQPIRQITNEESLRTINTTDLPKGIYILQLQKTNGQVQTFQFVK